MATMTPVLERQFNTTLGGRYSDTHMIADEHHNSCIKDNYARLLNPDLPTSEIIANIDGGRAACANSVMPSNTVESQVIPTQTPVQVQQETASRFVESARTNSYLFRADSPINNNGLKPLSAGNSAMITQAPVEVSQASIVDEEEENEDLRPTSTTTQYRTNNKTVSMSNTSTMTASHTTMSKRDKIIIAALVATVVFLFSLVIINSAIIANLNSQVSTLDSSLNAAKSTFVQIRANISEFIQAAMQSANK